MEGEDLQKYQLEELKLAKESHEIRIKDLEDHKILTIQEFSNFKQSLSDQQVLILKLDNSGKDRSDRQFDKMYDTQAKMTESQGKLLDKILDNQNTTDSGKIEITKKKLVLFASTLGGVISIVVFLLKVIFL